MNIFAEAILKLPEYYRNMAVNIFEFHINVFKGYSNDIAGALGEESFMVFTLMGICCIVMFLMRDFEFAYMIIGGVFLIFTSVFVGYRLDGVGDPDHFFKGILVCGIIAIISFGLSMKHSRKNALQRKRNATTGTHKKEL